MEELREKLKEKYGYEDVLVNYASDVTEILPEGFTFYNRNKAPGGVILNTLLRKSFFARRYKVESNPSYKQWIPYVVLKHGNTLYAGRRLSGSGESRLVGEITIGHGGHVNRVDEFFGNIISNNIARELAEEFNIYPNSKFNAKYFGFLNVNSDKVSTDHLGIVVLVDMTKPMVEVREKDKLVGGFVDIDVLKQSRHEMGLWSQMTLDVLYERMKG